MTHIKTSKYSLKEASTILTSKLKKSYSINTLFRLSENDTIKIVIYRPGLTYSQKKAASTGQDIIHQSEYHTAYPILSLRNSTQFVDKSPRRVTENLIDIDAMDDEGNLFKVSSYTGEYQIKITKKDLYILDIELERYLAQLNQTTNTLIKKKNIQDRRIGALKKFLKKNSSLSPHNHKYTRIEFWGKLSEFDEVLFPEWKNTTKNGGYKFELDGIAKAFIDSRETRKHISFK